MKKPVVIAAAVVALVLVFAAGWYLGRAALERAWSNPVATISADDVRKASVEGADPTPKEGTRVVKNLPLKRMRAFMSELLAKDPVVMDVGSFGRDDEGHSINLQLENRGTCKVTRVAGVVYGFDAWGRPARINKGGESYVAFNIDKLAIDKGATGLASAPLKDAGIASIAVAQVDEVTCEGGAVWKRPGA
jgi:hypothetical protein